MQRAGAIDTVRRAFRRGTLVAAASALLACRGQHVTPRPVAAPLDPAPPNQGAVSAAMIYDPAAPSVSLGPGEEYAPPFTLGTPLPQYPADLVELNLPPQVVTMRILVDERSLPAEITPSPLAREKPDERYRARFEESITSTVGQWKYWPAQIRKFRPGPDSDGDGKPDYRILSASLTLKTAFDIAFTFRVVNGKPVVTSDATARK